jgi:hypothetical protein
MAGAVNTLTQVVNPISSTEANEAL